MGLVLYSPADGDPSPSCRDPSSLLPVDVHDAHFDPLDSFNRHLPPSGTQLHDWRHGPSKARLTARRQASWAYRYEFEYHNLACGGGMREYSEVALLRHDPVGWPRRLRPHQLRLLQTTTNLSPKRLSGFGYSGSNSLRGQRRSVRDACINEMAVYQPRFPVPDKSRSRPAPPVTTPAWTRSARRTNRPPSLERQGAFRDASTAKRRMSQSESSSDGDNDNAELYSLGLLYDNEHACGAGFGLDTIVHDAPLYSISVTEGQSRGRVRGLSPRQQEMSSEMSSDINDLEPLPELGLSFANLADDAALARFLQDEEMAAYLASVPEGEHDTVTDWSCSPPSSLPSSSSSSSSSPVRVIYELAPEVEMEEDENEDEEPSDWVMDMAGLVGDDVDSSSSTDDNILFRTDASDNDDDNNSNPDDTWLLLRP